MKSGKDTFTILKQVAEAIHVMFGRNCEVAVHDLANLDNSLIHIAGNVTGRSVGAPATDLLVKELGKDSDSIEDIHNYRSFTSDGRCLKSTTLFLRDSRGIFAAFCINFDTSDFFSATQALNTFVQCLDSWDNEVQETFSVSSVETVDALFHQGLVEIGKQPAAMTREERMRLVLLLENQGVFQLKGAVNKVAEQSGVSRHTIYNYLKTIRKSQCYNHGESYEKDN